MSEVERFKCIGYMVGRSRLGGAEYVFLSDFDRVTAERDAALAENKLLRHNVASYLETVAKVCDMLSVDLESAKTAEGKPSDVLFGYVSLMQQRLTAADERADVLEGLLREAVKTPWLYDVRGKIMAALKPAEAARCTNCDRATVEQCDDAGCGFLGAGNGAPY